MLFICYPNCSTCKKAQKWLDENEVPYDYRNIKSDNPTLEELTLWHQKSELSLKSFFNTSGQSYRSLNLKDRLPQMSFQEKLLLLASDGMLVKRPLLISESFVLIGFKEPLWEEVLTK